MEMKALQGVRVLDLASQIGVYCTKLLADLGADVIKIEQPSGDQSRYIGPWYHDTPDPEKSLYFYSMNTNKRSITLDINKTAGRELLKTLVKTADIMVETFPPGYLEQLGLGYSTMKEIKPDLVMTSISGFGQTGPYQHWKAPDIVGVAMGGLMNLIGFPEDPPNRPYGSQGYYITSLNAAIATMVALYGRQASGEGQHIDVSMQECVANVLETAIQYYDINKEICKRAGKPTEVSPHRVFVAGLGVYQCKDGEVLCMVYNYAWPPMFNWMLSEGMAEDLIEERWQKVIPTAGDQNLSIVLAYDPEASAKRIQELKHVDEVFSRFVARHTVKELCDGGLSRCIQIVKPNSPKDLLQDIQLQARGFFVDVEHEELNTSLKYPGVPYRFSKTPAKIIKRAPLIGENNLEIYEKEMGLTRDQIGLLKADRVI